jgi:hypothetical protein
MKRAVAKGGGAAHDASRVIFGMTEKSKFAKVGGRFRAILRTYIGAEKGFVTITSETKI